MASPTEQKIHEIRGKSTTSAGYVVFANATATHLHGFSESFKFMIDEFHVVTWVEVKPGSDSPTVGDGDGEVRAEAFQGQLFHGRDHATAPEDTTFKGGDNASTGNGGTAGQTGGANAGTGFPAFVYTYGAGDGGADNGGGLSASGGDSVDGNAGSSFIAGGTATGSGDGAAANVVGGDAQSGAAGDGLVLAGNSASGTPGRTILRGGGRPTDDNGRARIILRARLSDPDSKHGWVDIEAGQTDPDDPTTAGLVAINSGTISLNGMNFSDLPTAAVAGTIASILDSITNVWGAVIGGGGGNHVIGVFAGPNWLVMGKL